MFAGGTGITPMYQLLQAIAADPEDTTTELRAMEKASMGRLSISFYVDEVTPIGPRKRKGRTKTGLVQGPASEGVYEGVLTQNVVERIISSIDPTAMVLGCGPPGMMDDVLLPAMKASGATTVKRGYIF
ncbi:conserved hypothetical protein [Perkinsus marinus ATCC 50983]|uniref:Oxidoreductase FAD/NAD(P)-binding domain-containing protein n=1 Tax=Perkinsus marinus (strain ATCC 50983 / TXsc) TaxID=423536 RepID=C5KB68_PERM5|nr:conserved hypothetical protein [Perkinsus marinus ATCC 50983]EER18394.1 conserved hypothetical protein [Perkinsus marinus ATCC 50983]|eukprot:XP_002786598.1 conserved hypothetical protein [Perkinsus marinus ATCC 50983]